MAAEAKRARKVAARGKGDHTAASLGALVDGALQLLGTVHFAVAFGSKLSGKIIAATGYARHSQRHNQGN